MKTEKIRLLMFATVLQAVAVSLTAQTTTPSTAVEGNATKLDSDEEILRLSVFEVKGSSEEDGYLTKSTSSAARIAVDYLDLAQTVSVMTSQYIADYNIQDVRKLFERMPNVFTGSADQTNRLWIRGIEVNSNYVDGVLAFHHAAPPLPFYDRVELVSGPSSSAFGVGQPGGIINYTTKAPTGRKRSIVEVGIGTYNNYRASLDTEDSISSTRLGKIAYRFVGYYNEGDYKLPPLSHKGAGGLLALRNDINDTTRLDVSLEYSRNSYPLSDLNLQLQHNQTSYSWHQAAFAAANNVPPGGNTLRVPLPNTNPWPAGGLTDADLAANSRWAGGTLFPESATNYPDNAPPYNDAGNFRASAKFQKSFLNRALTLLFTGTIQNITTDEEYITSSGWAYINPATKQPYSTAYTGLPYPNHVYIGKLEEWGGRILSQPRTTSGSWRAANLDLNYTKENFLGGDWQVSAGGNINEVTNRNYTTSRFFKNPDGTDQWIAIGDKVKRVNVGSGTSAVIANRFTEAYARGGYLNLRGSYFGGRALFEVGDRRDAGGGYTDNFIGNTRTQNPLKHSKGALRYSLTVKPLKWLSIYALQSKHDDPPQQIQRYSLANAGTSLPAIMAKYNNFENPISYTPSGTLKEFGVKAELLQGNLVASASFYDFTTAGSIITNVILDSIPTSPTYLSSVVENLLSSNHSSGGEFQLAGRLGKHLNLTAYYGITRGRYAPFPTGRINYIYPPTNTGLFVRYDFGKFHGLDFYLLGGGRRYGKFLVQLPTAGFLNDKVQYIWDLGGGVTWDKGRQSLEVMQENLARRYHYVSPQTAYASASSDQFFVKYKYRF